MTKRTSDLSYTIIDNRSETWYNTIIQSNSKVAISERVKWRAGEQTAREIMQKLGIKPNLFYWIVKRLDV